MIDFFYDAPDRLRDTVRRICDASYGDRSGALEWMRGIGRRCL